MPKRPPETDESGAEFSGSSYKPDDSDHDSSLGLGDGDTSLDKYIEKYGAAIQRNSKKERQASDRKEKLQKKSSDRRHRKERRTDATTTVAPVSPSSSKIHKKSVPVKAYEEKELNILMRHVYPERYLHKSKVEQMQTIKRRAVENITSVMNATCSNKRDADHVQAKLKKYPSGVKADNLWLFKYKLAFGEDPNFPPSHHELLALLYADQTKFAGMDMLKDISIIDRHLAFEAKRKNKVPSTTSAEILAEYKKEKWENRIQSQRRASKCEDGKDPVKERVRASWKAGIVSVSGTPRGNFTGEREIAPMDPPPDFHVPSGTEDVDPQVNLPETKADEEEESDLGLIDVSDIMDTSLSNFSMTPNSGYPSTSSTLPVSTIGQTMESGSDPVCVSYQDHGLSASTSISSVGKSSLSKTSGNIDSSSTTVVSGMTFSQPTTRQIPGISGLAPSHPKASSASSSCVSRAPTFTPSQIAIEQLTLNQESLTNITSSLSEIVSSQNSSIDRLTTEVEALRNSIQTASERQHELIQSVADILHKNLEQQGAIITSLTSMTDGQNKAFHSLVTSQTEALQRSTECITKAAEVNADHGHKVMTLFEKLSATTECTLSAVEESSNLNSGMLKTFNERTSIHSEQVHKNQITIEQLVEAQTISINGLTKLIQDVNSDNPTPGQHVLQPSTMNPIFPRPEATTSMEVDGAHTDLNPITGHLLQNKTEAMHVKTLTRGKRKSTSTRSTRSTTDVSV